MHPRRLAVCVSFAIAALSPCAAFGADTTPPIVTYLYPPAGASVARLTEIHVQFGEPVTGVDAADLRVNNVACTNVLAFGQDVFVFQFSQPATGAVQVVFTAGHGITDLAVPPNVFAGTNWTY